MAILGCPENWRIRGFIMNPYIKNTRTTVFYIRNFLRSGCPQRSHCIALSGLLIVISQFSTALQISPHYGAGFSSGDRKELMVRQIVDHVLNSIIEPQLGGQIPPGFEMQEASGQDKSVNTSSRCRCCDRRKFFRFVQEQLA